MFLDWFNGTCLVHGEYWMILIHWMPKTTIMCHVLDPVMLQFFFNCCLFTGYLLEQNRPVQALCTSWCDLAGSDSNRTKLSRRVQSQKSSWSIAIWHDLMCWYPVCCNVDCFPFIMCALLFTYIQWSCTHWFLNQPPYPSIKRGIFSVRISLQGLHPCHVPR